MLNGEIQTQVMIVGAGPVGMTLAAELVRYGIGVRIVDKALTRTDNSKALVLWSRTLELMDRGIGTREFLEAGFEVDVVHLISGKKRIGNVDLSVVASPYPYALMIPQSETERLLEERLTELGVRVERGVEVTAITGNLLHANATLRHPDGHEQQVCADWLVGCDGAHSIVRHSLGATFDGETNEADWMLADIHMTGYPFPETEASIYWHQDGAFVIFPISRGRYRVLADLPASGEAKPPNPTLEEVQAIIDRRGPGGLTAFDPIWLAGFRINGRKVSSYRWGRIFLAGDAAHVHSPAGGQGMNTGMQDAFNLAWKLALFAHGTGTQELLDSYSPERSFVGDQVLKSAGGLTKIATLRNPIAQNIRNIAGHLLFGLTPVRRAFADTMAEMTIGYPDSPLNGPSAHGASPASGHRFAPIAGQVPFGSGKAPQFALFAMETSAVQAVVSRYETLLERDVRSPSDQDHIWLVRPDGYVACVSHDLTAITSYLERFSTPLAVYP